MDRGEGIGEREWRYMLDGSEPDLDRLLTIADIQADTARTAFSRIGLGEGWTAIDCGCGPLGVLRVMADMVGLQGRVVGVDLNERAVRRARSVVARLGLGNVEVVVANVNDLEPSALGGPFDLAYARAVLAHQADPVRTLSVIAGLVNEGGWVIAQEPLLTPPPQSRPHVQALEAYWGLLRRVQSRLGLPGPDLAMDLLPGSVASAGLELVSVTGFFNVIDPHVGFEIHAGTAAALRDSAVESGAATAQEVDALVGSLREARDGDCLWVSSPFFLDITMRRPRQTDAQ